MGETREEILATARELFLDEGYHALTTRAIAERMDITAAGVHYHFETTDELLVALVESRVGVIDERLLDTMTEMIQECVDADVFETEDPEATARTLLALIEGTEAAAGLDEPPELWGTTQYVLSELCTDETPDIPAPQAVSP